MVRTVRRGLRECIYEGTTLRAGCPPALTQNEKTGSIVGRMIMKILAVVSLLALVGCQGPPPRKGPPGGTNQTAVRVMMRQVSPERVKANVDRLAAFGTRHTLSDTESDTRGIGASRRWILGEFASYAEASGRSGDEAMEFFLDSNPVEPDGRRIGRAVDVQNVVAVLPGSMPEARGRLYYVLGHNDSRNSDANDFTNDAPGANDDASGVSLLMELARVMSAYRFDSTLVFIATSGEEQGLYGAREHAKKRVGAGADIRAVLNNDTVGDPSGAYGQDASDEVRVFSEGLPPNVSAEDAGAIRRLGGENDSSSRQLARYVDEIGQLYKTDVQARLIYRHDRFLRGGDHTPFNELGVAAVRFVEVHENYDRQHQDVREEDCRSFGDLPEHVDGEYLAGVTRLNLATLAHLANAPSVPTDARIITADLTNDTTVRWTRSPEPDVAGYVVVWRATTSPVWEHARNVGDVSEATIRLSKDNWIFGVRAYDHEGYRSPVATLTAARE